MRSTSRSRRSPRASSWPCGSSSPWSSSPSGRPASTPTGCLRAIRPLAARSALTATLISRLVPLAAADGARMARGGPPARSRRGAARPRRDRPAADRRLARPLGRHRRDARAPRLRARDPLAAARGTSANPVRPACWPPGSLELVAARRRGRSPASASFDAYPEVSIDAGPATLLLALALPAIALAAVPARCDPQAPEVPPWLSRPWRSNGSSTAIRDLAGSALAGIDLRLDGGEFVVLAGRSGSGKSTLLRAGCGLVPHFHGGEIAGEIRSADARRREHRPRRACRLGRVRGPGAGDPGRLDDGPGRARAAARAARRRLRSRRRGRSRRRRSRWRSSRCSTGPTDSLSGGELQRVALGAALVTGPPLLLLDEPTSQLDPVAGDELIALLRRLNEEWGVTVLLGEHRLERCLAAADRVVALDRGAVVYDGDPAGFGARITPPRPGAGDAGDAAVRPRRDRSRAR